MASPIRTEDAIRLKFGGGIHSRPSEDEINEREAADGQNFLLDIENREFRRRPPFDLLGTAPNAGEIRGFAQLLKSDGTTSMLVQAGTSVYLWDGASFTLKGTVSASARLRGRLEHNFQLDDKVLITDIALAQALMEWDGTTLQNVPHNLTGDFKARYCFVSNERAFFGNVESNGTATPHMLVGATRGDFTTLSISDRPASSLNDEDPFFLLTPDLRGINGLEEAFQQVAISSEKGSMFILSGSSAKDFSITELFPRSAASGTEAVRYIGDDIVYGRQGRIESLISTDKFGDVETDDLTLKIADKIETFKDWTAVYNSRLQRAYFFPTGQNELWVFNKSFRGSELSPWSKWVTAHPLQFQPSTVMNMLDPVDGLEYVFKGDTLGNLYRLEGSGTQDAGVNDIKSERLSKMFTVPVDAQIYDIDGWVRYRKDQASTLTLSFEFSGVSVFNETKTINIPAITGGSFWGGDVYWGGDFYWGTPFSGRFTRQVFDAVGQSNEIQVRATIDGSTEFQIAEIGLRFKAAS